MRVFEHQKIRVGETIDGNEFTDTHLKLMIELSSRLRMKVFHISGNSVKFNSVVGVLQLGRLCIEILPKLDKEILSDDVSKWQNILLDMLIQCGWLRVEKIPGARLKMKSNRLLDYFIQEFLQELQDNVLSGGLPSQYERLESKRLSLKGKLLLTKQLREKSPADPKLWMSFDHLNKSHWTNHLLWSALISIETLDVKQAIKKKAKLLRNYFPKECQKEPKQITNWSIPTQFRHLEKAIHLAKLIYQGSAPGLKFGQTNTFALVFDMNQLFEAFITKQIRKQQNETTQVYSQISTPFWQERHLRPDIFVNTPSGNIVIDTKWKVLKNQNPEMEDLRQIYLYAQYFNAEKVILLYPKSGPQQSTGLIPFRNAPLSKAGIASQILLADLFTPMGSLKRNIGEEIIGEIGL